jgi:hypothetical protein
MTRRELRHKQLILGTKFIYPNRVYIPDLSDYGNLDTAEEEEASHVSWALIPAVLSGQGHNLSGSCKGTALKLALVSVSH